MRPYQMRVPSLSWVIDAPFTVTPANAPRAREWALFVGQWPAAFMLMGVYNKMVKQHGSDAYSQAA
jgi:hypothetical protein